MGMSVCSRAKGHRRGTGGGESREAVAEEVLVDVILRPVSMDVRIKLFAESFSPAPRAPSRHKSQS
jgi:hypothetical protein